MSLLIKPWKMYLKKWIWHKRFPNMASGIISSWRIKSSHCSYFPFPPVFVFQSILSGHRSHPVNAVIWYLELWCGHTETMCLSPPSVVIERWMWAWVSVNYSLVEFGWSVSNLVSVNINSWFCPVFRCECVRERCTDMGIICVFCLCNSYSLYFLLWFPLRDIDSG